VIVSAAAFSPNGRTVAFNACTGWNPCRLLALDTATGKTRILSQLNVVNAMPAAPIAWSPNSKRIAFAASKSSKPYGSCHSLYTIRADGSGLRRLTRC
jgi:Tol biopolymer transport system component